MEIARTGNQSDFISADSDIPIDLPCGYVPDSNICPHISQDSQINAQGKLLLDLCISCGLRIMNGRHKKDPVGNYTCYTSRECSVVDYFIVSSNLHNKVTDFFVGELPTFSDHCPLHLAMDIICALKQCLCKLKSPPVPVALYLFNSIVQPVLCYGCEIWGFTKNEEIEVHYLKYILHLQKSAINIAVHGKLSQFPIQLYWKENIHKYWCRVNAEEVPLHVKQAVLVKSTMLNDGKSC